MNDESFFYLASAILLTISALYSAWHSITFITIISFIGSIFFWEAYRLNKRFKKKFYRESSKE